MKTTVEINGEATIKFSRYAKLQMRWYAWRSKMTYQEYRDLLEWELREQIELRD